ncbi:MAG: aminotransferase class IV [Gemmatimonadetes bacterium]|nr:aminotransferase class IV [Gemmatimonadota bacterium]
MSIIYLNGQFIPRATATLAIDDRGFIFGDGVYEVTRVVNGELFESSRHLKRLGRGLADMRLQPEESLADIEEISRRLIVENGLTEGEGTVYLQITRGAAPRTHHFPPAGTRCTVFMSAQKFVVPHDKRATGVSVVTYPDIRWSRCDIKTVNLIPAVLAKQHAVDNGVFESIFVRDGTITEGSHTNCFGVIDGELRTYPASNFILGGVTRDVTIELAHELGIPFEARPFHVQDLPRLEEFFVTGTTTDVMPVVQLDGRPVGNGRPGEITMRLYNAMAKRLYGGT